MRLQCGCCGNNFSGKQHWNHDRGFGICPGCQESQDNHNEVEWNSMIDLMATNLNEANRETFLAYERPVQLHVVSEAIKAGIIYWKVGN